MVIKMNVPKLRFNEFNTEWNEIKLSDYCTIITKGTTPSKFYNSGIRFIKIESLNNHYIDNSKCLYIDDKTHFGNLKRSILFENDILFAIAGATVGKCGIVRKINLPANTNQALSIIRLKNSINPLFVLNCLDSYNMRKYIFLNVAIGAQPNLNLEQIANFRFKIPSKIEQDKIINLINLLDKKIELQLKKIEALKLYKLCILKYIFSSATIKTKLKSISNIKKGEQINSEELSKSGSYYMLNGGTEPSGYLEKYNTLENTITISEGGNSCGYVKYNKCKFWCGGHCYSIENKMIDNHYLYQSLKFNENKIMRLRIGSGLPNIQKKDLENFELSIHEKNDQHKIAKLLIKCDTKIELEQDLLNLLLNLKKGLMQNMFV